MKKGDHILFHDLVKKFEINDTIGIIVSLRDVDKRYGVRFFQKKEIVKVKKKNIKKIVPNTFIVGGTNNNITQFINKNFTINKNKIELKIINGNYIKLVDDDKISCNFIQKHKILVSPIIIDIVKHHKILNPFMLKTLITMDIDEFPQDSDIYTKILECLTKYKYKYLIVFMIEGTLSKEESDKLGNTWFIDSVVF